MKVATLKDFQKLVSACRKLGVSDFKGEGFEFHLGPKPQKPRKLITSTPDPMAEARITVNPALFGRDPAAAKAAHDAGVQTTEVPADKIETPDTLTDEQLLFYSVANEEQA